jgi:energy-coupling factor transporter transmembrane protein EcfT
MEPVNEYLWIIIAMMVSFIISLFVFFKAKRKWTGCLLQLFTFIVLFMVSGFIFAMFRGCVDSSNESEAMVGIRLIEEDRDCRFETKWWMKPDNTYYYEFEKESNHHQVEPCGNDSYSDKGTFTRIDSIYAIKANINPNLVIYFDLDCQKVTPIYNNDTIEVISTDWNLIKEYFKQTKQNK